MQKTFLQTKTATSVVACTRYDQFFFFSDPQESAHLLDSI